MKKGLAQVLFANIIFLLVGIVSNFLLPKYLSIESYSYIKTYALYISYAGFFHLGYNDGMYLKYGGKKIENISKKDLSTNFLNYIFVLLIASIGLAIFGGIRKSFIMYAFAVGVFATNFIGYFKSFAQAIGEYNLYGKALNYEKILVLIFDLLLIFLCNTDNYKLYLSVQVLASIIIAVILCYGVSRKTGILKGGKFSISEIIINIRQGFILMLGNFSSSIFTGMDRWFVKILMNSFYFAQYSFAVSVEQIINVFITPITVSMYNYFCRETNIDNIKKIKKIVLIWGCLIIGGAFPLKFIIEWILPKYKESSGLIFILFAAHAFYTVIKGIYVNYYKSKLLQKIYFWQLSGMTVVAFVTNCIAYYLLKSMYSFAFATLLTALLWYIVCEISTKELRADIRENIAFALMVSMYLVCGLKMNAIIGCICYVIAFGLILIFLMRDTLMEIIKEIKMICNKLLKKKENGYE